MKKLFVCVFSSQIVNTLIDLLNFPIYSYLHKTNYQVQYSQEMDPAALVLNIDRKLRIYTQLRLVYNSYW
jgi:hypothetical protein